MKLEEVCSCCGSRLRGMATMERDAQTYRAYFRASHNRPDCNPEESCRHRLRRRDGVWWCEHCGRTA